MPTALTTTGMIIGEINTAVMLERSGQSRRLRPSAASVPSVEAAIVENTATMMLFFNASCQTSDVKNSRYHCNEKPGIGYVKNGSELNDNGMIARIGAIRNSSTPAQKVTNKTEAALRISAFVDESISRSSSGRGR